MSSVGTSATAGAIQPKYIDHSQIMAKQARMIPQPVPAQALQKIVGTLLTNPQGIPANLSFAIHTTEAEAQAVREKLV